MTPTEPVRGGWRETSQAVAVRHRAKGEPRTDDEASSADTPYGRYITSEGWFVLNLGDALAVRNEEKGGATYPIEPRDYPFADFGVHVVVLWPGDPNALYHSEGVQEGFLVLSGSAR